MTRTLIVLPFGILGGAFLGLMLGAYWVTIELGGNPLDADMFMLLRTLPTWAELTRDPWKGGYLFGLYGAGIMAVVVLLLAAGPRLTGYGNAHFQSRMEIRKNELLAKVGSGLVFGRIPRFGALGRLFGWWRFVTAAYDKFPHCLVVAPTRAGKGVGYAIPNLLMFPGSIITLDVKGELFEATSRHRAAQGDEVFYFSPFDFEHGSHRYNPLERVAQLKNMEECYTEMAKIADYFLTVSDKGSAGDFLTEGRDLFVAAGLLAIQRNRPTIGEICRILFAEGATSEVYKRHGDEVRFPNAAQTFRKFSGYSDRTLSSHASVLSGAGLSLWNNPAIDRATSANDFSFADLRRKPTAIYLVVNADAIKTQGPLIRLFFGEFIATMRATMPDPVKEPWPVQALLDEFDQLGPMPIVVQSLKQLAGHGVRVSIITQSVPGLESTPYTENERLSIEASAGIKLYLSANEKKTAAEISEALGKTTKLSVSDSTSRDNSMLLKRSVSRRNEERALMTPDEIKRLDRNKVILVPERQHPILADRIIYYEDPYFQKLMAAQKGPLPYPSRERQQVQTLTEDMAVMRDKLEVAEAKLVAAEAWAIAYADSKKQDDGRKKSDVPTTKTSESSPSNPRTANKPAAPVSEQKPVASQEAGNAVKEVEDSEPLLTDDEVMGLISPSEEAQLEQAEGFKATLMRRTVR